MSKGRPVKVTQETSTGLNRRFHDMSNGCDMTRGEFADRIERGDYPDYHVRRVNGRRIPASNPNGSERDNLG